MTTRNEAADVLHEWFREHGPIYADRTLDEALAAAKAEGAREAVERAMDDDELAQNLAMAMVEAGNPSQYKTIGEHARAVVKALRRQQPILQDERESSLGRDAEGHLVLTLGPGSESPSQKGERE